ncbi:MAG: hypothetical protein EAZ57_01250 [Cytophagales bacterium]|nr:MAG: hypothetical protein EAZ67_02025 [Cytophagales bacterium]TAF62076.1 MAG: hypothetical protein EAZ57_01250 [Cytophagales bacterium]
MNIDFHLLTRVGAWRADPLRTLQYTEQKYSKIPQQLQSFLAQKSDLKDTLKERLENFGMAFSTYQKCIFFKDNDLAEYTFQLKGQEGQLLIFEEDQDLLVCFDICELDSEHFVLYDKAENMYFYGIFDAYIAKQPEAVQAMFEQV